MAINETQRLDNKLIAPHAEAGINAHLRSESHPSSATVEMKFKVTDDFTKTSEQVLRWMLDAAQVRVARYRSETKTDLVSSEQVRIAAITQELKQREAARVAQEQAKWDQREEQVRIAGRRILEKIYTMVVGTGKVSLNNWDLNELATPADSNRNDTGNSTDLISNEAVDSTTTVSPQSPAAEAEQLVTPVAVAKEEPLVRTMSLQEQAKMERKAAEAQAEKARAELLAFVQQHARRILEEFTDKNPDKEVTGQDLIMYVLKDPQLKGAGIVKHLKVVDKAVASWVPPKKEDQALIHEQRQSLLAEISTKMLDELRRQGAQSMPTGVDFNEVLQAALFDVIKTRDPNLSRISLTTSETHIIESMVQAKFAEQLKKPVQDVAPAPVELKTAEVAATASVVEAPVAQTQLQPEIVARPTAPRAPVEKQGFFSRLFGLGKQLPDPQ